MTQGVPKDQEPIALHQTILLSPGAEPPVFVLTVPKSEVASDDEPLADLLPELLGGAGPVTTSEQWVSAWRRIDHLPIWMEPTPWFPFWAPPWILEREVSHLREALAGCVERPHFARAMLQGLLSHQVFPPLYAGPLSATRRRGRGQPRYWLFTPLFPPLAAIYWQLYLNREELQLSAEEVAAWIQVASVISSVTASTQAATESLLDFDVPFSLSRRADKTTLSSLLAEARIVAFVPLAPGALQAANLIGQGNYVVAMEVAAVSGGVTLVLAATYSLAEFLLNLPRRRQWQRR